MTDAPVTIAAKRRWFRYSLRTLFVVFTIFCLALGWVMWNLNWIRQRREIADPEPGRPLWGWPAPKGHAPSTLWLFGETGWQNLQLYYETQQELAANARRVEQLFPEAKVSLVLINDPRNDASSTTAHEP